MMNSRDPTTYLRRRFAAQNEWNRDSNRYRRGSPPKRDTQLSWSERVVPMEVPAYGNIVPRPLSWNRLRSDFFLLRREVGRCTSTC